MNKISKNEPPPPPPAEVEEENEVYLKYVMNITTLNITVESGGQIVMQQGSATPPTFPPK